MELEKKIEHVVRCVKLGMTLDDSLFLAECTDKEIETLYNSDEFLREIKLHQKLEEMNLLRQHNTAMEISASRGNAKPIEWKLGILNKNRWGSRLQVEGAGDLIPKTVNVTLVGKAPSVEQVE